MTRMPDLPKIIETQIADAVAACERERPMFVTDANNLQQRLLTNPDLKKLVHSSKVRAKDPSHLFDKLQRAAM